MPDNWGFVAAAYLLTALVLGAYWQRLLRQERRQRQHDPISPRPEPASRPPLR